MVKGGVSEEKVILTCENSDKAAEKTRRRTSCNIRRGKERKKGTPESRCPSERSILKLLIHLILLGFASASLARDDGTIIGQPFEYLQVVR